MEVDTREHASMREREDLETLMGLVERYSPSGVEGEAVEWLVDRMRALGYGEAFVDEAGNAVGVRGEGSKQIVLLGHIDTVPGEVRVRIEEERLYGRGSVDAKGPLAAFVDAAARVEPGDDWQVVVIGAVDEERDSTGARHVLGQYQPDFAIIGEPSQWDRITLGYKGSAWSQVSVRRKITHTAGQERSACEVAVAVWNTISAWANTFNAGRDKAFDQVLPGLQSWASGNDGFEEWAILKMSVRLPPDLPPEDWYAQLRKLSGEAEVQAMGFPISAYRAEKNTPLVRSFLAAIREAGGKPNFVLKTGTADLNIVAPGWGCPAVAYGPGDSALDHTPEEHVSLEAYRRAVAVVQEVLRRLM